MKIVHVNNSDFNGGASIAVRRLHKQMLEMNYDSHLVVNEMIYGEKNTHTIHKTSEVIKSLVKKGLNRKIKYFFNKDVQYSCSYNLIPSKLINVINSLKPDIVNLHWIGNDTISISNIKSIKAKIVWTLHDMWPLCGAEHYSTNNRYIEGYSKINRPKSESGIDINRLIWKKKKKIIHKISKVICSSKWMFDAAKNSDLLKNKDIIEIPFSLNNNFWKPWDKNSARKFLGIDENKKVVLFGADNFISNQRKGFNFFKNILQKYSKLYGDDYLILLFGETRQKTDIIFKSSNISFLNLGKIYDENFLKIIYSAADTVVIPSRVEAFGLIALEAISCGTPCVVSDQTGLTSLISHKQNGYIAQKDSVEDFQSGIVWCLKNLIDKKEEIHFGAKKKFNQKECLEKYINFIKE